MDAKPLTNDGFGPQLTGKESIAELFQKGDLVRTTAQDLKKRKVLERISPELKKKLSGFTTRISKTTALFRSEIVLD